MTLQPAHRGYEYQDLIAALKLVDVLLGEVTEVFADSKFFDGDRFDDLTWTDRHTFRERMQIKHRDNDDLPLPVGTFRSTSRDLRLDELIQSAITDRSGPGQHAAEVRFRVLLRDAVPTDSSIVDVLQQPDPDPGPFIPDMTTRRFRFSAEALSNAAANNQHWSFLRAVAEEDLAWFCNHTIVEVSAPAASFDLTSPGPAELLLLDRVRAEIGAESYPNTHRTSEDVAAALINVARGARIGVTSISKDELLRRTALRHDFGAVARAYPVEPSVEVTRPEAREHVAEAAQRAATARVPLIVTGPPGQGKSWTCQRIVSDLEDAGWLVAEHFCFLGDADEEREARVLSESIIGSLLMRLAEKDPSLVEVQRPRFAADEKALIDALDLARTRHPETPIALIVDGLDHVSRVQGQTPGQPNPSHLVSQDLAEIELPENCTVVILSQPGEHLQPLVAPSAEQIELPPFGSDELRELAIRLKVISDRSDSPIQLSDDETSSSFLEALGERSAGNPLYATYLCREVSREPSFTHSPIETMQALPPFDGTLEAYYGHLIVGLSEGIWVAEVIALLDFAVTRAELKELRPELGHAVDPALDRLAPVLVEKSQQGGVRVYHESFARFLLGRFDAAPDAMRAALQRVVTWLEERGFLDDSRSFRYLLPTLARAGEHDRVVSSVSFDFAALALAAGFAPSAIVRNLAVAIRSAAQICNWPAVVRFVELCRAAESFEFERLDNTAVDFMDVAMNVLGASKVAERLLWDGKTTVPARAGLQLCAEIDRHGGVAPWFEYMTAFRREDVEDNTSYGEESDRQVALAWCRGRLRVATGLVDTPPESAEGSDLLTPLDEGRLVNWINSQAPDSGEIAEILLVTFGLQKTVEFLGSLKNPGSYQLALATQLKGEEQIEPESENGTSVSPRFLALSSLAHGPPAGALCDLIELGISVSDLTSRSIEENRERLLDLTRAVLGHRIQFETAPLFDWLDACVLAAHRDPLGLTTAEALLDGEGWYRCWLRFCIGLVRAEALSSNRSSAALDAIEELNRDVRPFVGDPRACDLYNLHGVISRTLQRALGLIDDEHWDNALRTLLTVSDETGTTLFGEVGGPISPHLLLRLIAEGTNDARFSTSSEIVESILSEWAGGKYYSDIAAFHLAAARFAVASGQSVAAREHWDAAAQMLVAYGWRKDITIWELLNPLDVLIKKDRHRSRQRLQALQPLTERVVFHTDGKDTRTADDRWWRLLAQADPLALAALVVPDVMRRANIPDEELDGALRALWNFNHDALNPILAGALRLSLDINLHDDDGDVLSRLAAASDPISKQLFRLVLSRLDERPTGYSYSNSDELVTRDNRQIESINSLAQQAGEPILQIDEVRPSNTHSPLPGGHVTHDRRTLVEVVEHEFLPDWGTGAVGLGRAVRAWRRRSPRSSSPARSTNWYANAIGYRLLDTIASGRTVDAESAIWAIAQGVRYGDDATILVRLAEGLEAHGEGRLAALSHALAWTRTRGGGGWLNFGGETQIESLRRAAVLDPECAWRVISQEIESLVRERRYGTYGVSQALIQAAADVEWDAAVLPDAIETAFKMWDEAAEVIAWRLPHMDERDDPRLPYEAASNSETEIESDELHLALAAAVLGALAHPSRERKRRSLLSFQLLLKADSSWVRRGTSLALSELSDPSTLAWVLAVLLYENLDAGFITSLSDELLNCSNSNFLTVRALARSILEAAGIDAGNPPVTDPHPNLLMSESQELWTPDADSDQESEQEDPSSETEPHADERAEVILQTMARRRLIRAEQVLPGLSAGVRAQLALEVETPEYKKKLNRQMDALSSRAEPHWPDAFTAPNETAERVLQEVGSGGRSALAAQGDLVPNPAEWELGLANRILNSPRLPLQLELVRIPRPALLTPPNTDDPLWNNIAAAAAGTTAQTELLGAIHEDRWFSATVRIQDCRDVPRVIDGSHEGWCVIGWSERHEIPSGRLSSSPMEPSRTFVKSAIELRQQADDVALDVAPFADGDVRDWKVRVELDPDAGSYGSAPLVGNDSDGPAISDTQNGLGRGMSPLVPTRFLIAILGLEPHEEPFRMDQNGEAALLMETWRTRYHGGEYGLPRPLLVGGRLILRPDLFDQLQVDTQGLCSWREFISGWLEPD